MKRGYDFSKGKRGAVTTIPKGKTRITIRLDADLLAWFREEVDRAGGGELPNANKRSSAATRQAGRGAFGKYAATSNSRGDATGVVV